MVQSVVLMSCDKLRPKCRNGTEAVRNSDGEGVGKQVAPFKGATYSAQRASETTEEVEQRPRDRELTLGTE